MKIYLLYGIINFYMIFAVIMMIYYAVYSFSHRRSSAHFLFSLLCICVSLYGLGYLMEINVSSYEGMLFWNQIQYFGIPFFGPLWLLFNMEYLKISIGKSRLFRILLFLIPVTTFFMRLTNSTHRLFYSSVFTHSLGEIHILGLDKGIWYYVQIAFLTICVFVSGFLIIKKKKEYTKIEQSVFRTVILITLIPYFGMLFNLMNIGQTYLDYSAFSLPLVVFIMIYILFRNDFLQLRSYAREKVFENSGNGIIIMDSDYHIIDYNATASAIFPKLSPEATGMSVLSIEGPHDPLYEDITRGEDFNMEVSEGNAPGHYHATFSDITMRSGKRIGFVLNLSDVTEIVQATQKALIQTERQRFAATLSSDIILGKLESGQDIIRESMRKVGEFFKATRCFVYKFSEDLSGAEMGFEWTANLSCTMKDHVRELVGKSWTELSGFFHGKTYLIESGEACASCPLIPFKKGEGTRPIRHTVLIPVYLSGELVGVFGLDFLKDSVELEEDMDYITTIVNIVSSAVINEYTRQNLEQERVLLSITLMSVGDGVISVDTEGKVVLSNPIAREMTGWTNHDIQGKPIGDVLVMKYETPSDMREYSITQAIRSENREELPENLYLISKAGKQFPVEMNWAPILDQNGEKAGSVIVFRDFTEKKKRNDMVRYLSFHDQLTSVYNRRFFELKMPELDTPAHLPLSLVMADVNGLKMANDVFGHPFGDLLLKTVSGIMRKYVEKRGFLFRIGGDEFLALLPGISYAETKEIVDRMKREMADTKLNNIILSVSFGWNTKGSQDQSIHEILKKAEDEMYQNKLYESPEMRNKTMEILIRSLFEKIPDERLHAEAVRDLSEKMGEFMGLSENAVKELTLAAYLHDIGKMALDESVILFEGVLDSEGMNEIRRHSELGYRMLITVQEMTHIARIVLAHHENWDGSGYPGKLSGEAIVMQSRVIRIADSYDAMTRSKPYRPAITSKEALQEILSGAGTLYDPNLVPIFIEMFR